MADHYRCHAVPIGWPSRPARSGVERLARRTGLRCDRAWPRGGASRIGIVPSRISVRAASTTHVALIADYGCAMPHRRGAAASVAWVRRRTARAATRVAALARHESAGAPLQIRACGASAPVRSGVERSCTATAGVCAVACDRAAAAAVGRGPAVVTPVLAGRPPHGLGLVSGEGALRRPSTGTQSVVAEAQSSLSFPPATRTSKRWIMPSAKCSACPRVRSRGASMQSRTRGRSGPRTKPTEPFSSHVPAGA